MAKIIFSLVFFLPLSILGQVKLTTTNLPIVVINTNGQGIFDEFKTIADMKIIWRKGAVVNSIADTSYNYNGKIGIELRGSTSQALSDKKPYAIELRDSENNDAEFSLLDMPKEGDWALIAPYSDKTLLRDALTYSLAATFMDYAPRIRFCELVLNDVYQGVYVLTEKIKRGKNRVNIAKMTETVSSGDSLTGGYILKLDKNTGEKPSGVSLSFASNYSNGINPASTSKSQYLYHYPKPEDINTAQKNYIKSVIGTMEDALYSSNATDPVNGYPKYFDVQSLVDFLIMNELTRNVDGYRLSSYLYKDKNSISDKIKLGPVWDFNIALGNADYCNGNKTTGWAYDFNQVCSDDFWQVPFWWRKIAADNAFRAKVKTRWSQLRANQFSNTRIFATIDSMATLLQDAQTRNFQKWDILTKRLWPNPQINYSYSGEISYLKLWLTNRLDWIDGQITNYPTATQEQTQQAHVYPNPSVSGFQFDYQLAQNEEVKLLIYNNLGQIIFNKKDIQQTGENKLVWQADAPIGLYFYEIYMDNKKLMIGKLLKQ